LKEQEVFVMSQIGGPRIEEMSQQSLTKFLEDMRIVDVAFYGNPQAIHLFLASPSITGPNALLTITACDDLLSIGLEGTGADERERLEYEWECQADAASF
jgi:hypothetical protein